MPSTYMDLTNRLLRRLNDVEITESNFLSCKNIQATAKDAILDTVREINSTKIDWPFNAVEHEQTLTVGVEEYGWPFQFTAADWNSFQLQEDDTLGTQYRSLKVISREEWYQKFRDLDYNSLTIGKNMPSYVFPSHGMGWGVTPSPDKAYPIKYRYYKNPTDLTNYNDEVTIPSKFDYVIIAGALYHMNLFKENPEGVAIMQKKFESGLKDMTNLFLPNMIYMYDGRVNFGGGSTLSSGYWGR